MTRQTFVRALPILAALPLVAAYAGGWAVITVETLPNQIVVGQPTNLTFSIRQHGMRLMGSLEPRIEAEAGPLQIQARAVPTNREGYYTATLTLPRPAEWTVTIKSGFNSNEVRLLPIPATTGLAHNTSSVTAADRGRRLFVAKGCVSCHVHGQVAGSGRVAIGPDLTSKHFPAEYLQQFLANPAVKPNWSSDNRMPNLNLKPDEIAALIAFLNPPNSSRTVSVHD